MTTPYKTVITRLATFLAILACFLLVPRAVYAEADIPEEIKDNGIPVIALTVSPAG